MPEDLAEHSSIAAYQSDRTVQMGRSSNDPFPWHSYQFSCRAEWTRVAFSELLLHFKPLELHVVEALGRQQVLEHSQQQKVKASTQDNCVLKGHEAEKGKDSVRAEIESFKRLWAYIEVPRSEGKAGPCCSDSRD